MFGLNFKSILVVLVLIFLLVSVVALSWLMYSISSAPEFTWDAGDDKRAITKGAEVANFFAENKKYFIGPTISNVFAMVLVGLILYLQ